MFCFRCGAAMPDQSPSCPQCGTAVSEAPQIAPRAPLPAPPVPSYSNVGATPQPYPVQQPTEGKATASMILGILSLTCFNILTGVPAVILGHLAKSNIRKSGGRLGGGGSATAGLVMGYISVALFPLLLAVAIPAVLRGRSVANESSAQSTVRMINTAQVSYSLDYPSAGYARDLATLGPGASGSCAGRGNQSNACLLDATLGCSGSWCVKNGYKFRVTGTCGQNGNCPDYVLAAIPLVPGISEAKSFCSTSEAVIRMKIGGSSGDTPTVAECQSWPQAE